MRASVIIELILAIMTFAVTLRAHMRASAPLRSVLSANGL